MNAATMTEALRLQPHNLEAEQSVLGAILLDGTALSKALEILSEEDFYESAHCRIFGAMRSLGECSEAIDTITLAEHLKARGELESVGGAAYLAELVQVVPTAANVRYHCKIVRDKTKRRQIIAVTDTMQRSAYADGKLDDLAHAAASLRTMLDVPQEPASPPSQAWPVLDQTALYGLAGDVVRQLEPHTESDPVALLVQFLAAFGNVLNRGPHFRAEADAHHMNLFIALVGETSKGRKGTSWGYVRKIFQSLDPDWARERIAAGLSSGEGLIWSVRDPIYKNEPVPPAGGNVAVCIEPGITDKRLLVVESEMAGVFGVMKRQGNTLSALMRQAWETGDLRAMTKNAPAQATGAHISIVGHVTRDEILRMLTDTDAANGLANRFLWITVRRSKALPDGGHLSDADLQPVIERLRLAVQFARSVGEIQRDDEARCIWHRVYHAISEGKPGLLGAVVSRAEAQTMRLACLYAFLDRSATIKPPHLLAALALWDYCETSARYIFGERLGDPIADDLLTALRSSPQGMTRTEIRDWFGRNRTTVEIDRGLRTLAAHGLVSRGTETTQGRPLERWTAKQLTTKTTLTT